MLGRLQFALNILLALMFGCACFLAGTASQRQLDRYQLVSTKSLFIGFTPSADIDKETSVLRNGAVWHRMVAKERERKSFRHPGLEDTYDKFETPSKARFIR